MKLLQSNPKDASAVILHHEGKVLLQQRSNIKGIFYPNFWGLFGGAKNNYEKYYTTAIREINEELNLKIDFKEINYFFKLDIQFPISKKKHKFVKRYFYIYQILDLKFFKRNVKLGEGRDMMFFSKKEYNKINVVPYDKFAIDLFYEFNE